jgi:nucleolar protein 4
VSLSVVWTLADAKEAKVKAKADKKKAAEKAARASYGDNSGSDDDDDDDDDVAPPLPGKGGNGGGQTAPAAGASIFIRDLPSEASKQMLYERMQKFGKVRSCRLVIDKATGRATGTAFVDFHNADSARGAVDMAAKVEGGGVKVAGRRISLALAVSASEVGLCTTLFFYLF